MSTPSLSADWTAFVTGFLDRTFTAQPHFAVYQGRHEFDGQLPDWTAVGLDAEVRRLHRERARVTGFDPASLDDDQRFEREYLLAVIDGELFWREVMESPCHNPEFYSAGLDPNVYVTRPYASLEQRMRAFIAYAGGVPAAAEAIRRNLRTPMPRTYIDLARTSFGGLASYLEAEVPAVFAPVQSEALHAQFAAANDAAVAALTALDTWFGTLEASATGEFAMGEDRFRQMLWATERVDLDLDTLEAIGRRDLERNLDALRTACARYAPAEPIAVCVRRVQSIKPEGGPVAAARSQLEELKSFVVDADLVSIPRAEEAQVEESPPYMRWNAAFITIPGPFESGLPSTYYIAPPDPSWSLEDQAAYTPARSDLLFVSAHEVWPGHFLQFLHAHQAPSDCRRVFATYAFSEGWAHYVEEMVVEAGLGAGDAETHIGQLLNALLRNVRYLSAIGLHTGRMTVAESERMFREQAFQDPGNARQQAARGTFDPAYLNYTMGKLMIRKLREDWTASRGGRRAWREFHDRFLSYGSPPIPLVRAAMLGGNAPELFPVTR